MGFDEEPVYTDGGGGLGKVGRKASVSSGGVAFSAGGLDGVCGIEDDGVAEFAQDDEATHVGDEGVVAKGGAAFGEEHLFVAGGFDFFDDVSHIPWG